MKERDGAGEKRQEGDHWGWDGGSVLLCPPLLSHCPGHRMASGPRLLGGAGPCARPSGAQQQPFVTQCLLVPWPLVSGVQVDWILSWQPTDAALLQERQDGQEEAKAPSSCWAPQGLWWLLSVVLGCGGPQVRAPWTPAAPRGQAVGSAMSW